MFVVLNGGLELGSAALLGGDLSLEGLALGNHTGVNVGSLEGGFKSLGSGRDVRVIATLLVGALVRI